MRTPRATATHDPCQYQYRVLLPRMDSPVYVQGDSCKRCYTIWRWGKKKRCVACMIYDQAKYAPFRERRPRGEKDRERSRAYEARKQRWKDPARKEKRRAWLQKQHGGKKQRARLSDEERLLKRKMAKLNRKIRKRNGTGQLPWNTRIRLLREQNGRCVLCCQLLDETAHLDHIVPLASRGAHARENVQLLCPICNMRKGILSQLTAALKIFLP